MVNALQALIEQQRTLDQRELEGEEEASAALDRRETNFQAIDHLEQAIAHVRASNTRDAVVQVLIATGRTLSLEQDSCPRPLARQLDLVSRLLRSALPILAQQADVDLEACGGSHYGLWDTPARTMPRQGMTDDEPLSQDAPTEDGRAD